MENYKKESKEIKDMVDLSNDIDNGIELINKRRTISKYIRNQFGFLEINAYFIQNENDIVQYINNINKKYSYYINMVNFFQSNIQWNLLENCVELLQKILNATILGKAIEEVLKGKEN